MSDSKPTVAVVGVCGGAGATRLAVEAAATLARAGRSVAVVDVAFATQGLSGYVPGRIDPDVTRVLLEEDRSPAAALVELPLELPGRVAALPARAPFERLARAGTAGAARALGDLLGAVAGEVDAVLVDTPPVATNQAVAAVTEADRVGLVAPASERGADALQRVRARLADVGAGVDAVVANRAAGDGPLDADVAVPESAVRAPSAAPACVEPDTEFAPAVARAAEALLDEPLELDFPEEGLLDGVRERVGRS